MRSLRFASRFATLAALAACSTPPAPPAPPAAIPAYLQANTGCAILAGGAVGSQFTDRQVEATWNKINTAVTNELHDRLVANKYRTVKLIVPGERALEVHKLVFESAAANRCSRVLQVAHKVDEDTKGKYFLFDVSLYRAVPKPDAKPTPAGLSITTAGEYQRAYRYPRTEESFRNFYTGDFAEKVLADLTASGALAPLR